MKYFQARAHAKTDSYEVVWKTWGYLRQKNKLNQSGHKLLKTITSTRRFWLHYGIVGFYKFKTSDSLQLRLNEGIVLWNPQSIHAVLTTH